MSTSITPELRAEILASIKEGTSIADAAKANNITERTIKDWMKPKSPKSPSTPPEVARLRREVQQLKELLGSLLLERELSKKNPSRSS